MKFILKFLLFQLLYQTIAFSQNTVTDVLNNTVDPCTLTVGTVVTVSNAVELRTAIDQANSGGGNMTILLQDGTYQIASTTWYPYITASNLVFRSVSGNRNGVIICGSGMHDVSPGTENGFYIVGNNVTIADLTVRDVGNHAIAADGTSSNVFIYNVRFQDTYEQMFKGTNSGNGSQNGKIQCCLFEYTAGIGPQYYIGGIDIHKGSDWIVQDNVFIDIKSPTGVLAEHAIHFWNNSSDNLVERNLIINCDRGIGFGLGSSGNTGGSIRNNMIYNNGSGPNTDVGIGIETSPGTTIYNNTVYITGYPNAIEYRFAATSDVEIVNNLTNANIQPRDGATATLGTNATNAQSSWFVDITSGNLRLNQNVATVCNQGTDLSALFTDDIDKHVRPAGSAFDIGAHEFGATGDIINLEPSEAILLYPNPADSFVYIEGETAERILILDCNGKLLKILYNTSVVDIGAFSPGIYYAKVFFGHECKVFKFLRQ